MYRRYLVLVMVAVIFIGCHKEDSPESHTPPSTPPTAADSILLKDVVVPRLPSPYYHFEYDVNGRMSQASFASGLRIYEVIYDGNRISELRNNAVGNEDRLQYSYDDNERVNLVNIVDKNNSVYRRCFFTYEGPQLLKMRWELNRGAGFELERTIDFVYHPDGNLLQLTDHLLQIGAQTESTAIDRYEQYDDKVNKYGFHLIHINFFDHLVLLPGVKFQKNNAKKLTRTGTINDYTVDYTYTYDNRDVPVNETGDLLFTNGKDKGKHFTIGADYSYY